MPHRKQKTAENPQIPVEPHSPHRRFNLDTLNWTSHNVNLTTLECQCSELAHTRPFGRHPFQHGRTRDRKQETALESPQKNLHGVFPASCHHIFNFSIGEFSLWCPKIGGVPKKTAPGCNPKRVPGAARINAQKAGSRYRVAKRVPGVVILNATVLRLCV